MLTENYPEDEIQALIALIELSDPVETPNNNFYTFYPGGLPAAQAYFRRFALDLGGALEALAQKGLLCREKDTCLLTPAGKSAARAMRSARPPIWYWYKDFYNAIQKSKAFSLYCRRVFGRDLSQHGFSDMQQIEKMLALLKPTRASRLLDIGCGNGKIAEYISDLTGAQVTGIDYIPEAIEQATRCTARKKARLRFKLCSIDHLEQIDESFAGILSIDSIFFGENLGVTLGKMKDRLAPGGQMAIFCAEDLSDELADNDLRFDRYDLSKAHHTHLQLKHAVAKEMKQAFKAEGCTFIWENLMAESIEDAAPFDPQAHATRRYLYHVST
jgi:cyclopropane fatty-acyl-phospholipid synthase-like methyltransferase